ncbi:hypothetical protein GCM10010349_04790 [Streptomyces flavofungini]|nr:hypothetical protein GCM10010349_04790 [Streptomyces flavofungini]
MGGGIGPAPSAPVEAVVKFLLEVDVDDTASAEDTTRELGRILRYWAGNLRYYGMEPGAGETVLDSAHREVGRWTITGA